MSKKDFFKDAIAEAKTIRSTALNVAKLSLEESLAPKIQSMISAKLNEMAEEDLNEGDDLNEESLEEIVNSLEESQELDESQIDESQIDESEITEGEEGESMGDMSIGEEAEGSDEVGEITVDDLKSIIADVFAEMQNGGEEEGDEIGDEYEEESEEEADLEEYGSGAPRITDKNPIVKGVKAAAAKAPELAKKFGKKVGEFGKAAAYAINREGVEIEESKELEEARRTITTLTKTLKEVNLLNAKLLYVNKIFKANNLSEGQKVKVVKSFDRAETVKDTQTVFNTLQETFRKTTTSKRTLKENLGRASKPMGNSIKPSGVLNENNNAFVTRMQQLAGITKH